MTYIHFYNLSSKHSAVILQSINSVSRIQPTVCVSKLSTQSVPHLHCYLFFFCPSPWRTPFPFPALLRISTTALKVKLIILLSCWCFSLCIKQPKQFLITWRNLHTLDKMYSLCSDRRVTEHSVWSPPDHRGELTSPPRPHTASLPLQRLSCFA